MNESGLIDRLAARLESLGLGPLAACLIELGAGPIGFLAAQGLYLAEPGLGLFVDPARLAEAAEWLDDPGGLPALAARMRRTDTGSAT